MRLALSGAGDFNVTTTLAWSGGSWSGSGTSYLLGSVSIGGAVSVSQRTVYSGGAVLWSTGDIRFFSGAAEWHIATGTFTASCAGCTWFGDTLSKVRVHASATLLVTTTTTWSVHLYQEPDAFFTLSDTGVLTLQRGAEWNGGVELNGTVSLTAVYSYFINSASVWVVRGILRRLGFRSGVLVEEHATGRAAALLALGRVLLKVGASG